MSSSNEAPRKPPSKRFIRPNLRQATLILPKTGERVKRNFTLQRSATNGNTNASTPLLGRRRGLLRGHDGAQDSTGTTLESLEVYAERFYDAVTSNTGIGVLKCSLAYLLGSLVTFVPAISSLLGHNDGKHMVATTCVYFHPARSVGSMFEAILLAMIAFGYTAIVSFTSMAVSVFFGNRDLLVVGHVLVLIVFCGGGLGLIGYTKQKLGNPLVNVACSLASLGTITVLTKEGAVQAAYFSYEKVYQVLKMVLMGVFCSCVVAFLIQPLSARKEVREDLVKITDLLEEILTAITRGFLSGSEDDVNDRSFLEAQKSYKLTFKSLVKNLREARFEHYAVGTEDEFELHVKLVKCIESLARSLGGLRSAASTQFSLLAKSAPGAVTPHSRDWIWSPPGSPDLTRLHEQMTGLSVISEESETPTPTPMSEGDDFFDAGYAGAPTATGASDIFSMFISQLGPPMKSLAFTLKEVLNDLPYGPAPDYDIVFNQNFRRSLEEAKGLFIDARHVALQNLYRKRVLAKSRSPEVAADYEEVAASCGHFSSSLEDFAEDTIVYLDILEELKANLHRTPRKRSWYWMLFWRNRAQQRASVEEDEEQPLQDESPANQLRDGIPSPMNLHRPKEQKVVKYRPFAYRLWRATSFLRQEDVKYAIKVGAGAVLYAMFSFIPSTRPTYSHWRGEWGLLSYMLVCSMTIGASNTTGIQRFLGTCLGALLAAVAWTVAYENPFALGFFGWLVAIGCFYIIVGQGKGPMGRFILLTYNLSALYAYSLSAKDDDNDDDEGGATPEIWGIVLHRVVAVMTGCIWGIIVTRLIWPISARRKVKDGTALLWLRMGLIWKRDPLQILVDSEIRSTYMDIRESIQLQRFLNHLEALRASAAHEFDLRGPFPDKLYRQILEATDRMLGAFHAMHVVIAKDMKASRGEEELLRFTKAERVQFSARISHLFSVLASSMKLEYPLNDTLPNIEHARDRYLAKLFTYRGSTSNQTIVTDQDFELFYAYGLVTGQIAEEIEGVSRCIEQLYGVLNEDSLKLR